MTAPQWRRVDVAGAVHLVAGRTGTGANPVVALHGLTVDHHSFDLVAEALQHSGGLLAPDLRGRGESAKPTFGYGLHKHAEDVIRMLDQQGIRRATLVGHSMGGYVALEVAHRYPDRVSGVILIDSGWPRPLIPHPSSNSTTLLRGIGTAMINVAQLSAAEFNAVQQDSWLISVTAPTARELRTIRCPISLIRASDGFTPRTAPLIDAHALRSIKAAIPLVNDVRLDGANHYTMVLEPRFARQVAAEIDRFQRQLGTRPQQLG